MFLNRGQGGKYMKNKYIILSIIASICILLVTAVIIVINKQGSSTETLPEQSTIVESGSEVDLSEAESQESLGYDSSEDLSRALAQLYKNVIDFGAKTGYYGSSDVVIDEGELSLYLLRASEIVNVDWIIQEDGESYMYDEPQDKLLLVHYRTDYAYTGGYDSMMRQLNAKYEAEHASTLPTTSYEDLLTEKALIIEEASNGAVTVEFIKSHAKIDPEIFNYYVVDGLQTINKYYPHDSYILCESDQTPKDAELDGFLEFEMDTRSIYGTTGR